MWAVKNYAKTFDMHYLSELFNITVMEAVEVNQITKIRFLTVSITKYLVLFKNIIIIRLPNRNPPNSCIGNTH